MQTNLTMSNTIEIVETKLLSDNWGILNRITFNYKLPDGSVQLQQREVYNRGNGAVILLFNKFRKTIILTKQFRIPTWFNGNTDGMMIEACAGLLDENDPAACIIRETQEETGYIVNDVRKIMEVYMSPASVTEILYFFIAEYSDATRVSSGGGLEDEHENIQVLEYKFADAVKMVADGRIKDAKTIMLIQYAQINNIFN